MNRCYSVGILGLFALSLASAQNAPQVAPAEAPQLPPVLKRALDNAANQRFTGTRIVEFRRMGETTRWSELVTRDGAFIRIEYPAGSKFSGQIIVENIRERKHFFPDKNEIWVNQPRREETLSRLVRMVGRRDQFKVATAEGATVAGVKTSQVVISDRDGNVVQRIYIEPRTGLLVKRQFFDPVGAQVGLYEFTKLNLNPRIDPAIFLFERKGAKIIRPIDDLKQKAAAKGFVLAFLKPSTGFTLNFSNVVPIDGQDVLMQFYSSDKGRISLYQTKSAIDPTKLSWQGKNQVNSHTWDDRGMTFVIIGSQTKDILKNLAGKVTIKD